jgi:hypothetical protein
VASRRFCYLRFERPIANKAIAAEKTSAYKTSAHQLAFFEKVEIVLPPAFWPETPKTDARPKTPAANAGVGTPMGKANRAKYPRKPRRANARQNRAGCPGQGPNAQEMATAGQIWPFLLRAGRRNAVVLGAKKYFQLFLHAETQAAEGSCPETQAAEPI